MRIAVCDDDPMELHKIRSSLEQYVSLHQKEADIAVYAYPDGDSLLDGMKRLGKFDLMILDILMPGMNGIELASEIRGGGDFGKIIFLTSSPEYAVDSYKVGAFYYLLKPFHQEELFSLIRKAHLAIGNEQGSSIMLKRGGMLTKVELRMLSFAESANHNVLFHLKGGEVIDCFGSLQDYESNLLADGRFVRCHKSFFVNMDFVKSVTNKEFILTDGQLIPISRNIYRQVKSAYFDYFFRKGKE